MKCNTDLPSTPPSELRENVIFYDFGHTVQCELPIGTPPGEIFYAPGRHASKEKRVNIIQVRKSAVGTEEHLHDIQTLSRTDLRLKYPKTYSSHKNLKQRCKNGYVLHPQFKQFPDFLAAMGPCPADGWTLDRINPSDPLYGPDTCRWLDKQGQSENRSNVKLYTDSTGLSLTLPEWSRRFGVLQSTIHQRLRRGWSVDEAVRPASARRKIPETRNPRFNTRSQYYIPHLCPIHTESQALELALTWKRPLDQQMRETIRGNPRAREAWNLRESLVDEHCIDLIPPDLMKTIMHLYVVLLEIPAPEVTAKMIVDQASIELGEAVVLALREDEDHPGLEVS